VTNPDISAPEGAAPAPAEAGLDGNGNGNGLAPVAPGQKRLILVDGSGYIFRAFHALPPMTRPDGVHVNAVYGFTQMLSQFLAKHAASHIAVVFDSARLTFRNDIYAAYKAHRPEPPPELVPQFQLIREATDALGVCCIEQPGYEADDMIAAYAKAFVAEGGSVSIVSSDKDLMQLIGPGVEMLDPIKQKPIREPEVLEKFGVTPDKVVDVQALAGDSTDNVPGVPGIGVKTAAQLITEYGDLETLLANAGNIKQPKRREALIEHAEKARISRRLVQLDADAPMPVPVEKMVAKAPQAPTLEKFLRENGFRSLLARLGFGDGAGTARPVRHAVAAPSAAPACAPQAAPFGQYETVTTMAALEGWIAAARAAGIIGFDTETDGLNCLRCRLVGLSMAVAPGRACYVPLGHEGSGDLMGEARPEQLDAAQALAALKPLLEDASVLKVLHNAKYDMEVLCRAENGGIAVSPVDDTMLISYAMDAGRWGQGMDELSRQHLGHQPVTYDSVTGTGRNRIPFGKVPLDKATAYAAEDADVSLRLWLLLRPRLREAKALALYEQVERRMVPVLRDMELRGIRIDAAELARIGEDFAGRLAQYETQLHALAGRPFNVGSPKQLGEILFDEMKLPGGRRSKLTGAWSTDATVLEELAAQGVGIAQVAMQHRQIQKLKSTYVEALAQAADAQGRIHTDYAMAVTTTGRLSSNDPNLQNIPIRTEEGARIRGAFVADPGHVLLSADYSQIELRILAHVADVPSLKQAFARGEDIHSRTAADIFRLDPAQVDKEARRRAKTINFGLIYGMSAFGLAARLGIPPGEAKTIIDAYFAQYPGVRDAMERIKEDARTRGYVQTPFGRRIWIADIASKDPARRAGAERAAINAPFQGGAAEIIKRAMVRIPHRLQDAGLKARMLLQVHDELVFEVPESEVEATAALVREVMENAATLSVPLSVDVGHGRSWAEAH
jgi:DNA polymerase-1